MVMKFGLTNTLESFETFIKDILTVFLNKDVTAYFNDILIYFDTLNKRQVPVRSVLKAMSELGIHLKLRKYKFHNEGVS